MRSALIKGGGWVKISDFAIVKGEQVKFKIFAIPWFSLNISLFYCPGGRTHGSGAAKGFSPSAPPPIFPVGKVVIWLANKVRETNLFSSFGY